MGYGFGERLGWHFGGNNRTECGSAYEARKVAINIATIRQNGRLQRAADQKTKLLSDKKAR